MSISLYEHAVLPGDEAGETLLFVFHGTGGNERQLFALGQQVAPGARIISPRGDVSEQGAARFFRRTAEGVYDMDDLARATEKMRSFVHAHRHASGARRVLGLGYSNGANILASVIFKQPRLFDRAVLMHPLIPFKPEIAGELSTRMLITAGRHDPICPPDLTNRLTSWLKAAGGDIILNWHDGGHELREAEIEAARELFSSDGEQDEADEIVHEGSPERGRYVYAAGRDEAELTYALAGGRMIIDHTFVPPAFREKGIALKLVKRAVKDARERGWKVTPLCSYAAVQFRRHEEWQDLLA